MYGLGVDLGTTWTAAAIWRQGVAECVPLGDRAQAVPSMVLVEDDGSFLIGEAAALRAATAPGRVASEFKRRFGDDVGYLLAGRDVGAPELVAALLAGVLEIVTGREGAPPDQVVVTVPATWREFRLRLLTEAAEAAGVALDRLTVLPEPVAAAVHYAGRRPLAPGTTVGIYDLGGGTFDATLLRKTPTGFEIVGDPAGVESVGGLDVDDAVVRRVAASLGPAWNALDRSDPHVRAGLALLRSAAVQAKEALSTSRATIIPVVLPDLVVEVSLTRDQLEADIAPLVQTTVEVFRGAIADAGLTPAQLDAILLVGGASRMPIVRRLMTAGLGVPLTIDEHPKYAVCLGAAVSAGSRLPGARIPPESVPEPESVPDPEPAVPVDGSARLAVDLASSGLSGVTDVPMRPAVPMRPVADRPGTERLVVNLGADRAYRTAGRRAAVSLTAMIVIAALGATLLGLLLR